MNQVLVENKVTVIYRPDHAVVRFSGDVNANRIFSLCDEIDTAINYYFYDRVRIEIDSPGGEAKALNYFINQLASWRKRGVVIETMALTSCCSAGAYMLSFGDVGHRWALPDSMLLYHNVRVSGGNAALTVSRLDDLRWDLSVTDAGLIMKLLRHRYGGLLPLEQFDTLTELVCCLPDPKRSFCAERIEKLGGARIAQMLKRIEACGNDEERLILRRDLYLLLTDRIRKQVKAAGDDESVEHLLQRLKTTSGAQQRTQVQAWLFGRMEWYLRTFGRDEYIRPEKAVAYGLIDQIAGV